LFVSFDVDHDKDLVARIVEQSRRGGSGFTVSARSERGEISDRWCQSARTRIRDADEFVSICGEHTGDSLRMNTELGIAQEEGKPYFLLWGRRERMCSMPARAGRTACMYSWTWEILIQQISMTLRNAQPLEIQEHEKRP
jgi:hypothetical protein